MIERFAVSCLYETISSGDFSVLDAILREMEPIAARDPGSRSQRDLDRYIELDRQFHYELCALTRNAYIKQFYQNVNMHLSMSFRYGQGACHGPSATFAEHSSLVESMKAHSFRAVEIIDMHLLKSRENILREPVFLDLPE